MAMIGIIASIALILLMLSSVYSQYPSSIGDVKTTNKIDQKGFIGILASGGLGLPVGKLASEDGIGRTMGIRFKIGGYYFVVSNLSICLEINSLNGLKCLIDKSYPRLHLACSF